VSTLTPRELEEYRALRDTIRERGTARAWIVLAGFTAWAGVLLGTSRSLPIPVASVLPLIILAISFEVVFALHTGVERIGRYIQVFFEHDSGWEHTAMQLPGGHIDPLFANFFRIATILNFVPAAFARPEPVEWAFVGAIHLLFIARLAQAGRRASRQRTVDLEIFQRLRAASQHRQA
jgi:hypothetical protein